MSSQDNTSLYIVLGLGGVYLLTRKSQIGQGISDVGSGVGAVGSGIGAIGQGAGNVLDSIANASNSLVDGLKNIGKGNKKNQDILDKQAEAQFKETTFPNQINYLDTNSDGVPTIKQGTSLSSGFFVKGAPGTLFTNPNPVNIKGESLNIPSTQSITPTSRSRSVSHTRRRTVNAPSNSPTTQLVKREIEKKQRANKIMQTIPQTRPTRASNVLDRVLPLRGF